MQFWKKGFYLNWIVLVISIVIAILICTNKLDIQRTDISDTIKDSTLVLRVVNFILTAEIFFTLSTFYGACVWYIIHRRVQQKKGTPPLNDFYSGGYSLLSTLRGIKSKVLSIKCLSFFSVLVMIAGYVLDIYYIDSISYRDITSCGVRNTTIDMMPSSLSSLSTKPASSASIFYAFGSKVAELPYKGLDFTNSYTVPALGDTDGLQDYTTILFNVSVDCQNPKIDMNATKNGTLTAQSINGTYIGLSSVSTLTQIIISPGHTGSDYNEIFISANGFQDTKPIGVTEVPFFTKNISVARCQTRVRYNLVGDRYDWGHDADFTSAKDIAIFAQRASLDMFSTLGVVSTKTVHSPITEWLTNTVSISTGNAHLLVSNISMSSYQTKLTMVAIEYLKGSGVNGSMTTLGNFCNIDGYISHISRWYKIVFTLVQLVVFIALMVITLVLTNNNDTLFNDTPTLLRYISNNKSKH